MPSWVVLQDHGVTGVENHLAADDEESTEGFVTSGMRLRGECESLTEESFVGILAGAHRAAASLDLDSPYSSTPGGRPSLLATALEVRQDVTARRLGGAAGLDAAAHRSVCTRRQ